MALLCSMQVKARAQSDTQRYKIMRLIRVYCIPIVFPAPFSVLITPVTG